MPGVGPFAALHLVNIFNTFRLLQPESPDMGQYAIKALQQSNDANPESQAEQECTGENMASTAPPAVVTPLKGQPFAALHIVNKFNTFRLLHPESPDMGQYAIKTLQQSNDANPEPQAEQDCTGENMASTAPPAVVTPLKGQPWLGVEKSPVGGAVVAGKLIVIILDMVVFIVYVGIIPTTCSKTHKVIK